MGANSSQMGAPTVRDQIEIWDERKKERVISNSNNIEINSSSVSEPKLPHNYENIMKEADSPPDNNLFHHLYTTGVFLNQKRKKYWVEKNSGLNCFMLYARTLSITWGEDNRYWHWPYAMDIPTNEVLVDVAELRNVCWLEVRGKFDASNLSPETTYEVVLVVMLKDPAYGWEVPVNLKLVLPNGEAQEHKVDLLRKPRADWIEIYVGEFKTCPGNDKGEIHFSMFECEGGQWKKGLVVKGVVIRPKS